MMKLVKTSCLKSARQGRLRVSLLEQVWVSEAPEHKKDFQPEKTVIKHVVAIQRGRKRNGEWVNDTLYLSPQEFRDLQSAIEDYSEEIFGEGEKPSSDFYSNEHKGGDAN